MIYKKITLLVFFTIYLFGCLNTQNIDNSKTVNQNSNELGNIIMGYWLSQDVKFLMNPNYTYKKVLYLSDNQFSLFSEEMGLFDKQYILQNNNIHFYHLHNQDTIFSNSYPLEIEIISNDTLVINDLRSDNTIVKDKFSRISKEEAMKYINSSDDAYPVFLEAGM